MCYRTKEIRHIAEVLNYVPIVIFHVQLTMWSAESGRTYQDMTDQGFHRQVGVNFPSFYRAGTGARSGIAGRWCYGVLIS